MLKVTKTKSGNVRINLDVKRLKIIRELLHGYSDPYIEQIYNAIDTFLDQQEVDNNDAYRG